MDWAQPGRSSWLIDQVSLARVSVVAPVCSRRTAAAAAEGASPITVPPSSTHAAVRARMAVVFPAPAGAMASWSRAPEVAIWVTKAACPGLRMMPLAACSSRARSTACRIGAVPVGDAGGLDEAGFGGEDLGAGVDRGAGDLEHAGPVGAAQLGRLLDAVTGRGQTHRGVKQGVVGDQVHDGVDVLGGQVRGADLTVRLGAHVPDLPGRTPGLDLVADPPGGVPHPRRIHRFGWCCVAGGQGGGHHERHPCRAAEDLLGLLPPRGSLLGQGAWLVLGVAGLQRGLLGQQDRLDDRRRPPVVALERGGELTAAGLDAGPPGRPALVQGGVDTDHLADRSLAPLGAGPLGECQPEPGA